MIFEYKNNTQVIEMLLTEDKLIDWVNDSNGLLITRRTLNLKTFNYNKPRESLLVAITGYPQIIQMFFQKILPQIICTTIVLIIVESDVVSINKEWLDATTLKHVFTWNKPFHHPKLSCLPISLNYNRQYDVLTHWLKKHSIPDIQSKKTKLLCMNCSLSTSPERVRLNEIVKQKWKSFCDILPFVSPQRQYFISSHIEGKIRIDVTNPKCYDDWKPYKFILSPQGAGLDCHRTWEAISCGVIPIVKSSSIDSAFEKLPVVIVKDWGVINETFLHKTYTDIMTKWKSNHFELKRLDLEFWAERIHNDMVENPTKNITENTIHFVTYGNEKYEKAKRRLCNEATKSGWFSSVKGYGPDDLPPKFRDKYRKVLEQPRGGGYWLWKPMIVYESFKQMKEGEYLVYLDAGCVLNKQGKQRFQEYIDMFKYKEEGILSFQMHNQLEKWWTTREVFEYYDMDSNGKHANSGQLLGGVFILKKNIHSEEYLKQLVSITLTQSHLYTDQYNKNGRQQPWFKDNRHDQSISSLLRKKHGSIIIPKDESFITPFGGPESFHYPFWAARSKQ